jgi:hypothetical protein
MLFRSWMAVMTLLTAGGVLCCMHYDPDPGALCAGLVGSEVSMTMWHRHVWHSTRPFWALPAAWHRVHHAHPRNPNVDAQDLLALGTGFITLMAFFIVSGRLAVAAGVLTHYVLVLLVHDELAHGRALGGRLPWLCHVGIHHLTPNQGFSVLWRELVFGLYTKEKETL